MKYPYAIFITAAGDIFISDAWHSFELRRWILNNGTVAEIQHLRFAYSPCLEIFVDLNDNLYCSISDDDIVVKLKFHDEDVTPTIAAGWDEKEYKRDFSSILLDFPTGIFVDTNFDLYVADTNNHRIQRFPPDRLEGTTVAGYGSPTHTIRLLRPTGVILDADKNLFIADQYNHRIVRSGPNGFSCIVGCSGSLFYRSGQLFHPTSLTFDSFGNIFVVDRVNYRIQKFSISENVTRKYYALRRMKNIRLTIR